MRSLAWPPTTDAEAAAWSATVRDWPDYRSSEEQRRDEYLEARAESLADALRNGDASWREDR